MATRSCRQRRRRVHARHVRSRVAVLHAEPLPGPNPVHGLRGGSRSHAHDRDRPDLRTPSHPPRSRIRQPDRPHVRGRPTLVSIRARHRPRRLLRSPHSRMPGPRKLSLLRGNGAHGATPRNEEVATRERLPAHQGQTDRARHWTRPRHEHAPRDRLPQEVLGAIHEGCHCHTPPNPWEERQTRPLDRRLQRITAVQSDPQRAALGEREFHALTRFSVAVQPV